MNGQRGPRVLVVEDHTIITQALTLALEAKGMDVEVADGLSSMQVIAQAEKYQPDVVLLDLYLEEMDSLPFIRPLTNMGATVVMLTGSTDKRLLGECLEAGAAAIIQKGESLERLVDAIQISVAGFAVMRASEREGLVDHARRSRAEENERMKPFSSLTHRERLVLKALVDGKTAETIAEEEYVALATVRSQIRSVLIKLGVNSQLAPAAMAARKAGWDAN